MFLTESSWVLRCLRPIFYPFSFCRSRDEETEWGPSPPEPCETGPRRLTQQSLVGDTHRNRSPRSSPQESRRRNCSGSLNNIYCLGSRVASCWLSLWPPRWVRQTQKGSGDPWWLRMNSNSWWSDYSCLDFKGHTHKGQKGDIGTSWGCGRVYTSLGTSDRERTTVYEPCIRYWGSSNTPSTIIEERATLFVSNPSNLLNGSQYGRVFPTLVLYT